MIKNIVVIQSKYQLDLFVAIKKIKDIENIYCVIPTRMKTYIKSYMGFSSVVIYDSSLDSRCNRFIRSRKEIKALKKYVVNYEVSSKDVLWIANDENQIDQCLYNIVKFENVKFFEDGIGSYLCTKFMNYNRGWIYILKRIKTYIYYFPYYRALYGCGGNIASKEGYSYHMGAFPMQPIMTKNVVDKEYTFNGDHSFAPDDSVVIIGQPLVAAGFFSEFEYINYVKYIIDIIVPGREVIYRLHPLERDTKYLEGLNIDIQASDGIPVEDFVFFSGQRLSVYSFVSTSLLHINAFLNVDEVVAIQSYKNSSLKEAYALLRRFGVRILKINI